MEIGMYTRQTQVKTKKMNKRQRADRMGDLQEQKRLIDKELDDLKIDCKADYPENGSKVVGDKWVMIRVDTAGERINTKRLQKDIGMERYRKNCDRYEAVSYRRRPKEVV